MATAKIEPKIYVVTNTATGEARLVEASTKAAAVGFVAAGTFKADRATQRQLVEAIQAGAVVESAVKVEASPAEKAFNEVVGQADEPEIETTEA